MAGLNAKDALIFRITHIDNVSWFLDNGLHCQNANKKDPNFIEIGMQDLISKRRHKKVPKGPGGVLGGYVPFYFTPYSIMMLNIKTGYHGVTQRPNKEIVILVSSIPRLVELGVPFVFTNGHAYMAESEFFDSADSLDKIDWKLLQARDFKNDPEDPGKLGRYQAEALVYLHMPIGALLGIACYDDGAMDSVSKQIDKRGLSLRVEETPSWYH